MELTRGPLQASVVKTNDLRLTCNAAFSAFYKLSPFVWRDAASFRMLLRIVNPAADPKAKVARIHYAESSDGLNFAMGAQPAIAPGSADDADRDGCEDPTAVPGEMLHVYYSGWNRMRECGELMRASGSDAQHLLKRGVAIASTDQMRNPKEASLACCRAARWRIFFEYASDDASKIGCAQAPDAAGPWRDAAPCALQARPGAWDDWHLSPGPIIFTGPQTAVMFYNGANRAGHWRIGWAVFDPTFERIVSRCTEPLIVPPPPHGDETDIAFAASAVHEDEVIALYYTTADKDMKRALIQIAS